MSREPLNVRLQWCLKMRWRSRRKEFFVKQITWAFHNPFQRWARWNGRGRGIIKNPFDIVQLILQLFAPLTELMELAKFPSSPFLLFYFIFLSPFVTRKKVRLSQHQHQRNYQNRKNRREEARNVLREHWEWSEVNFFNSFRSNSTAQETLNSISHFFHSPSLSLHVTSIYDIYHCLISLPIYQLVLYNLLHHFLILNFFVRVRRMGEKSSETHWTWCLSKRARFLIFHQIDIVLSENTNTERCLNDICLKN